MSDSSTRDQGIGVTLKGDKGYEAPWITFTGSPSSVKADLIEVFGFDETSNAAELDLHDLVIEAAKAFNAQYATSTTLGGKPVGGGRRTGGRGSESPAASQPASEPASTGDAWDATASEAPSEPEAPAGPDIPALIAACASVAELRNLWADHLDAIKGDAELLAAWKARGKALTDAAAA